MTSKKTKTRPYPEEKPSTGRSLIRAAMLAVLFAASGAAVPLAGTEGTSPDIPLRILAINDFHGHIATSSRSHGGVGGADYLSANIRAAAEGAENAIFVSAGDLIHASPFISAYFHDEPTIEAMNLMGLDLHAVGNHEFDKGLEDLLRMRHGGSHRADGDLDGTPFSGADFEFLAANVTANDTGRTIFPAFVIREYGGVPVAFIGVNTRNTPFIVAPEAVEGLSFHDEAHTVNALVPGLRRRGVESIVVLLHEGGFLPGGGDGCAGGPARHGRDRAGPRNPPDDSAPKTGARNPWGGIAEIVPRLDSAVDLVITGHTHDRLVCEMEDGRWVTRAGYGGFFFTRIDVTLNRATKDMTVRAVRNVPNARRGVTPDPVVTALIDRYDALSAPRRNAVIGTITEGISRARNAAGESALGDVIADAQFHATNAPGVQGAVVAFTNAGGIRADLDYVSGGPEAAGRVTFGHAFNVQPFSNRLVTMTLTGTQIDWLLEQQWLGRASPNMLQVSGGFTYTWDPAGADGEKVDFDSIRIGGERLNPGAGYRVTVNSFLAAGGNNFSVLLRGAARVVDSGTALDALVGYFGRYSPVSPGPQNRITKIGATDGPVK